VEEGDGEPLGTLARGLIDEADTLCFGIGQLLLDVLAGESHVVDTDALVLDELGDGRLLRGGLEELNLRLTQHKEGCTNLLVGHLFDGITLQTQHVLPVGDCLVQALDGNAKVLNVRYFYDVCLF